MRLSRIELCQQVTITRLHDVLPFVVPMLVFTLFSFPLAVVAMRGRPVALGSQQLNQHSIFLFFTFKYSNGKTYPDLALPTRHTGGGDVLSRRTLGLLRLGRHGESRTRDG